MIDKYKGGNSMKKIIVVFCLVLGMVLSCVLSGSAQEATQQSGNAQADNSQDNIIVQPMTEIVVEKNNQPMNEQPTNKIFETTTQEAEKAAQELEKANKKKEEDKTAAETTEEKDKVTNPEEWADDETNIDSFSDPKQGIWKTGGGDSDIRDTNNQFNP